MSGTLSIDTLQNGAGASVPVTTVINGSAKAWVNFDGQGTAVIRGSFNVSSVTIVTAAVYRVVFTTPFADTNYAVNVYAGSGESIQFPSQVGATPTAAAYEFTTYSSGMVPSQASYVYATFFR